MELCCDREHEINCISKLEVSITLTKKGLVNYEKVIDAVFKYIQRLKEVGPQEWVFNEDRQICQTAFYFAKKEIKRHEFVEYDPLDYAINIARNMSHFKTPGDLSEILREAHVAWEFNPSRI